MQFNGVIKSIKEVTSKNGNLFLEVHLEEQGVEYPNSLVANVWGDKVEKFKQYNKEGDNGTASINAIAKPNADGSKLFNNLTLWRFDKTQEEQPF